MRRVLAVLAASVVFVALTGCDPAPTITAVPSTLTPTCSTVTTVTGKGTPAAKSKIVYLEIQGTDGKWTVWQWFPDGTGDTPVGDLTATPDADGNYSLTYFRPRPQIKTLRLRVRGAMRRTDENGPVSKSWYVTNACA